MISKAAIREFLKKDFEDFGWVKKLTHKQLDKELKTFSIPVTFHTKPRIYQKACFLLAIYLDYFLFFLDMGSGKTKVILDTIAYHRRVGETKPALVLVPNLLSIDNWVDEVKKHTPELRCIGLAGDKQTRTSDLEKETDIVILNYGGLQALLTDIVGKKRQPNLKLVSKFRDRFGTVVLDESHKVKNHESLTFRLCRAVMKGSRYRFALSGTPFGSNPADLWSQFYLIDRGETLGETLGLFRAALFTEKENHWSGFPEYVFDERKRRTLRRMVKNRSIRYNENELGDLPKLVRVRKHYTLASEAKDYYDRTVKEIRLAAGNYTLTKNAFMRMRQVCSGFVTVRGEDNVKVQLTFPNPKLDLLRELVLEMPEDSKMVIFNEFVYSGQWISQMLKEEKIKHTRLWSGTKNRKNELHRFNEDPQCRIAIVNHQSGGTSLNLQVANYEVFYESPVEPTGRKQAEKRCSRLGQKKKVFAIDLVAKGSVEVKILTSIRNGKALFDSIIEGGNEI